MGARWNERTDLEEDTAEEVLLAEAFGQARSIAGEFTEQVGDGPLRPEVSVRQTVGARGQPLFVFALDIDMADDLAVDDYPMDEIYQLVVDLRSHIRCTPLDRWSWLVMPGTKAGRARS